MVGKWFKVSKYRYLILFPSNPEILTWVFNLKGRGSYLSFYDWKYWCQMSQPSNHNQVHYNILLLFSLQKNLSVQVAERKCLVLFTICFKTLLYTNLILIIMNSIFVVLLHIKHFVKAITLNKITWLHLNEIDHSKNTEYL